MLLLLVCPATSVHPSVLTRNGQSPLPPFAAPSRKVLLAASVAAGDCVRGISRYAQEHGWHLISDMLFTGSLPRNWHGDGVVAALPYQPELLEHVQSSGLPCVAVCPEETVKAPSIEVDQAEIGRLGADHLLERAHRSFAWAPFVNDGANRERLAAFQSRLAEYGCTCRLLPPAHGRIGPYWQDNWREYRRSLLAELPRLPRPTAIFAFNDCVAAEIVDACHDAGMSVPEEIAVLGAGNSSLCEMSAVPLSSVATGMEEAGYRAAAALDALINGVIPASVSRVPPEGIVTRLSTNVIAVPNCRVARALTYIAEHFPNPMLGVTDVAEAVGMSRRNLERSFRDETGSTIKDYIIGIRMREASRLLKQHPRAKASDVAGLVGLSRPGTFFRTFRRYFGVSPKAHRDWAINSREVVVATASPAVATAGLAARPRRVTVRSTAA